MEELKNLAYTLKRSGFDKQASRVYSLIKTAALDDLKRAIVDDGTGETKNQDISNLINNFKGWYSGLQAPPKQVGSPGEQYFQNHYDDFVNAIAKLKILYPRIQSIQAIRTSSDQRHNFRFAYGSLIKLIDNKSDMNKDEFTADKAVQAHEFAKYINSLQPPAPAQKAVEVGSSYKEFKEESEKLIFGGYSEDIKNSLQDDLTLSDVKLVNMATNPLAFSDLSSLHTEKGMKELAGGLRTVTITDSVGLADNFDNYIYARPRSSTTLVSMGYNRLSVLIYAGVLTYSAGGLDDESKKDKYRNILTRYENYKEEQGEKLEGRAKLILEARIEALEILYHGIPLPSNDKLVESQYNYIKSKYDGKTNHSIPVFYTNHPIQKTACIGSISVKKISGDVSTGDDYNPVSGKITGTISSSGEDEGMSTQLALFIESNLAKDSSKFQISEEAMQQYMTEHAQRQGDVISKDFMDELVSTDPKIKGVFEQAIDNLATIATKDAATKFNIPASIFQKCLDRVVEFYDVKSNFSLQQLLKWEDLGGPKEKPFKKTRTTSDAATTSGSATTSGAATTEPVGSTTILYNSMRNTFQEGYYDYGDEEWVNPAIGDSVLDLSTVNISNKESLKRFNTLILNGERGIAPSFNPFLMRVFIKNYMKPFMAQINVRILQALRISSFLHYYFKGYNNGPFDPLKIYLLEKVKTLMDQAKDMLTDIINRYNRGRSREDDRRNTRPSGSSSGELSS